MPRRGIGSEGPTIVARLSWASERGTLHACVLKQNKGGIAKGKGPFFDVWLDVGGREKSNGTGGPWSKPNA